MTAIEKDLISPERRAVWSGWDKQIRIFARAFLCHARLPSKAFSFLDVGCGIGSAIDEMHNAYPEADFVGLDLDSDHIEECRRQFGEFARFIQEDLYSVRGHYDVIYASNVLEHLSDWAEVARHLVSCSSRLYIMVPYRETVNGQPIRSSMGLEHTHYFTENSFDFLRTADSTVAWRVIRAPYAWGHPMMREWRLRVSRWLRNEPFDRQRQLLVAIKDTDRSRSKGAQDAAPFFSLPVAWLRTLVAR